MNLIRTITILGYTIFLPIPLTIFDPIIFDNDFQGRPTIHNKFQTMLQLLIQLNRCLLHAKLLSNIVIPSYLSKTKEHRMQ